MQQELQAGWTDQGWSDQTRGKMHVFFHTQQVPNTFESVKQGRPIFMEKVFLKKLVPGDQNLVIDRPMRPSDMEEFPVEWARFEQKSQNTISGTPIDLWPVLSDTQKAEFRALNIFTIDQFANLPDSAGAKIMGFNDLRKKAQLFIEATQESAQFSKLKEENAEKIKEQSDQIEKLTKMVADLMASQSAQVPKSTAAPAESIVDGKLKRG